MPGIRTNMNVLGGRFIIAVVDSHPLRTCRNIGEPDDAVAIGFRRLPVKRNGSV